MQSTTLINKFKSHLFSTNFKLVDTRRVLNKKSPSVKTCKTYNLYFATVWHKKPSSLSRKTLPTQKYLNCCNLTTLCLYESRSSNTITYFGRSVFINNHKNRLVKKSISPIKLQFNDNNLRYLQYVLNYTWFIKLLTKTSWQIVSLYLQSSCHETHVWVKNKTPLVTFWDQLLLTKI